MRRIPPHLPQASAERVPLDYQHPHTFEPELTTWQTVRKNWLWLVLLFLVGYAIGKYFGQGVSARLVQLMNTL